MGDEYDCENSILRCTWGQQPINSSYPGEFQCSGANGQSITETMKCTDNIDSRTSSNIRDTLQKISNGLTKVSSDLGNPVDNGIHSPLDMTQIFLNFLDTDFHEAAMKCQTSVENLEKVSLVDIAKSFGADMSSIDAARTQVNFEGILQFEKFVCSKIASVIPKK